MRIFHSFLLILLMFSTYPLMGFSQKEVPKFIGKKEYSRLPILKKDKKSINKYIVERWEMPENYKNFHHDDYSYIIEIDTTGKVFAAYYTDDPVHDTLIQNKIRSALEGFEGFKSSLDSNGEKVSGKLKLTLSFYEKTKGEPGIKVKEIVSDPDKVNYDNIEKVNTEFPGGESAFRNYLAKEIEYPKEAVKKGVSGKVYVQFRVHKDGSIGNINVVRGIGAGCDKEAKRVIKNMPEWNPSYWGGKPVKVRMTVPIRFSLSTDKDK